MNSATDFTLVGGGIIGLLTARELLKAGASVTLIDKGRIGQESSWAGGGILLPLYPWRQHDSISRLVLQSLKLYPSLASQLLDETGIDPEWTPCGLLITQNPDIDKAREWCHSNLIRYEPAHNQLLETIHADPLHPIWLPDIAQARNPRLVKSLKHDLLDKGAEIRERCEVTNLTIQGNRISEIETGQGKFMVGQLVLSAGAWTGQLYQRFFPTLPGCKPRIGPVKGQMLLYDASPETLSFMVLDGDHYLIPRRDGKILAGSSVEHDEFNKTPTNEVRNRLAEFAVNLLPTLKQFPIVRHWAGLRPGTDQGIPYIDRHPDIVNLSINAGHFRNGLAMGPASAQLLVDLLLNRPTQIEPAPYRLSNPH